MVLFLAAAALGASYLLYRGAREREPAHVRTFNYTTRSSPVRLTSPSLDNWRLSCMHGTRLCHCTSPILPPPTRPEYGGTLIRLTTPMSGLSYILHSLFKDVSAGTLEPSVERGLSCGCALSSLPGRLMADARELRGKNTSAGGDGRLEATTVS